MRDEETARVDRCPASHEQRSIERVAALGPAPANDRAAQGRLPSALWTGIGLGLYIIMISVTGSVLVYRDELNVAATLGADRFDGLGTAAR